jgi:Protein of unknown function (DUF3568)
VSHQGGGVKQIGLLALGLAVALATSGCVAAGLAAGPLMSAVQLVGDRTVERTVAAELAEAQGATEAVLARMAFRIESRERDDGIRRLRAVADEVTVHARLERVTAKLTRVGLRVETGRMVPDRDTGAQMHEQIAALLAPVTARPPAGDPAAAEALTSLQGEIRKLRSDIDERRAAERPAAASENSRSMRVEPGAVVTAPMSAALPTVGGPAPSVSVAVPAVAGPPGPVAQSASLRREPVPPTVDARTAAPLLPAGTLTPIQPAMGVGSGK